MIEGDKIVQYCKIKKVVNVIRVANRNFEDETMIRKVLRTLLHVYSIIFFGIQELKCTWVKNLTLEGVIGRFIAFEMSIFDN